MSKRAESGPMQFGDDWPGIFLRGDAAGPTAMYLRTMILELGDKLTPIQAALLEGHIQTLESCVITAEQREPKDIQMMRPFDDAVKP